MIRTFIVEDEPFAMKRICRLIEEINPEFEIIGTAMDGEEALEKLQDLPCDLVFTDIRMPVMDGVEFMGALRQSRPEIMIVAVSGYSDFSYVSSALRAKAIDYLLKPVSEEELRNLLARVRAEYLRRQDEALRAELASRINKAVPAREAPGGDDANDLGVFLFCAGVVPLCENPDMCPGSEFWGRMHFKRTMETCLKDAAQFSWEFMGNTAAERIVIIKSGLDNPSLAAQVLHTAVMGQSDMPITCICNTRPIALADVEQLLRTLRSVLTQEVRVGKSRFLAVDAPIPAGDFAAKYAECLPLAREILEKDANAAAKGMLPLFRRLESEDWPQNEIFGLFRLALNQSCAARGVDYRETRQRVHALEESFSAALNMLELQRDLAGMCAEGEPSIREREGGARIARRIAEYLDAHYAEHITNQTLSNIFGYVPSYLSLLFRREYNISPVEYLTGLRISRAKQIMNENPDALVKDIAESVGFKSQYHFSHTFKKYEGIWPTGYKAQKP